MQSGFWRKCRVGFRWCRHGALAAVLALICAFVWFDRMGVPDFLQQRLVDTLREHGVELDFSRLRFSLFHGLIAENVHAGHSAAPDSPAERISIIKPRPYPLNPDIGARLALRSTNSLGSEVGRPC